MCGKRVLGEQTVVDRGSRVAPARYASAAAFADDLQRYLDGLPVAARRGGLRYRLLRFARRHNWRMATAAALAVAVVAVLAALRGLQGESAKPVRPRVYPFSRLRGVPIAALESRFVAAPEDVDAGAALALALVDKSRYEEAQIIVARLRQIPGKEHDPLVDYADGTVAQHRDELQRALVLYTRARDGALRAGPRRAAGADPRRARRGAAVGGQAGRGGGGDAARRPRLPPHR